MKTIITNESIIQRYVPEITAEKDFSTMLPYLIHAEENEIKPLIGADFLQLLRDYDGDASASYSASNSGAVANSYIQLPRIIDLASEVIAYNFAFEFAKTGDVHFTSMGIQTVSTETHKSAFEYQKNDVLKHYAQRFDTAVDNLLSFLEENNITFWPDHLRTHYNNLFTRNASEFSKHCNIFNSRRTFLALRPIIEDVQLIHIRPVTGEKLFETLVSKIPDYHKPQDNLTKTQKIEHELITRLIPRAVANQAVADALNAVSLRLFGDGYSFASFIGLFNKVHSAYLKEKDDRVRLHQTRAQTYLGMIRDKLEKNADAFPDYPALPSEDPDITYQNKKDKNHYLK